MGRANRDGVARLALWLAFRALLAWRRLAVPRHRGALVAVWCGGAVLLVRTSYRPGVSLPGGGVRRGEAPREAAVRELREEVGLAVAPDRLRLAWRRRLRLDGALDDLSLYELELRAPPALLPDRREVVAGAFLAPERARRLAMSPWLRAYLRAAGRRRHARNHDAHSAFCAASADPPSGGGL